MAWNVMDALNNKPKVAADNKPKARFRTKDIEISKMYSNDMNFYSLPDIEQLAQDIFAVGLLENLTVVYDPCDRGEYRIIAGERRWRALTHLVEQGHEEFAVASCQIKTPAEEHEELIQLIIANTYRNKTTADILEEQQQLEETLKYMKENGLTLHGYKLDSGRLRDTIADMMQVSATKIAQIESINKKLITEFTTELKEGRLTFSAAYEISKMSEDIQEEMLEKYRETGLTYKEVKEFIEKQKKAEEEEQIDGQLSIEDVNNGACQNLTQEEKSDQSKNVVKMCIPTEKDKKYLEIAAREIVSVRKMWFRENLEQITSDKSDGNEVIRRMLHPRTMEDSWVFEDSEGKSIGDIRMYNEYIQLWIGDENRGNFLWLYLTGAIRRALHTAIVEETEKKQEELKNEEQEETKEIEAPDTTTVFELEEEKEEQPEKTGIELSEERKPERPELPKFKNNDQRKEWLRNYKAWGLWYTDRNIDVNYYKYDFADGSRLIAVEYPERINEWTGKDKKDSYNFHLLEKNKKPYGGGKAYDKQYVSATDSETYLIEFIKNLQKNG